MTKKILLVGSAPLPDEKSGVREASGLRTEQFLAPLQSAKENYEIVLVAIFNKTLKNSQKDISEKFFPQKNTRIFWISRHSKNLKSFLRKQISSFSPDVVIGVNTFPAYIVSTVLPPHIPFWADLNGWIMSEAQARGYTENTNLYLANAFRQERQVLFNADKISTVSTAQKFVTIGELATMGLLRKENFLEEKVFALPNCTKFFDIDKCVNSIKDNGTLFRKNRKNSNRFNIPNDAFVISWIGGYNNWVDEKTLFEGVEKAMSTDDNIYFVSTGGTIENIANKTFSSFLSRVKKSQFKNRFIFLGWIQTQDMKKVYKESDVGLNVDFLCVETETGARNRINEMLKFGLPVITTGGSEISEISGKFGAGITVKNGDSESLFKAILRMSQLKNSQNKDKRDQFLRFGKQGKKLSIEIFNENRIQKPVLDFVKNPQKTFIKKFPLGSNITFLRNAFLYLRKNGLKIFLAKLKQRIF